MRCCKMTCPSVLGCEFGVNSCPTRYYCNLKQLRPPHWVVYWWLWFLAAVLFRYFSLKRLPVLGCLSLWIRVTLLNFFKVDCPLNVKRMHRVRWHGSTWFRILSISQIDTFHYRHTAADNVWFNVTCIHNVHLEMNCKTKIYI